MANLLNHELFNRYKINGTGNSGTTLPLNGNQNKQLMTIAYILHQASIVAQALLPQGGADITTFLANLDTAISTAHTGIGKNPN